MRGNSLEAAALFMSSCWFYSCGILSLHILPVQSVLQQLDILGCVLFQSAFCMEREAQREQQPVTCTSFITFISRDGVS